MRSEDRRTFTEFVKREQPALLRLRPAAAVRARALDAEQRTLAEFDLVDGVAAVEAPGNLAAVQTMAADGAVLAEQPLMGFTDRDQE